MIAIVQALALGTAGYFIGKLVGLAIAAWIEQCALPSPALDVAVRARVQDAREGDRGDPRAAATNVPGFCSRHRLVRTGGTTPTRRATVTRWPHCGPQFYVCVQSI